MKNHYSLQPGRAAVRMWFALFLAFAPAAGARLAAQAAASPGAARAVSALPERLSDSSFWNLVTDISEPGGYFRITDNFTSNEIEVGELSSLLRSTGVTGGVFLGVGPEQNLSYIAAIHPKMAFIVDIRRQAVMQHLMFKAMFELARDRADFISLLFARPRPAGIDSTTGIQKIWDLYWPVRTDSATGMSTARRIEDQLTRTHGFKFTKEETGQLESVMQAFQYYGPAISTRGAPGGRGGGNAGGFWQMTGASLDGSGQPQSFLSSEDNYRYVKGLHEKNLIVAVSGDFGGPKAIRAIGAWLKEQHAEVSAFYVSNVEQYLFGDGKERAFYDNVATLPVNPKSVFIRPYSMRRFGGYGYGGGGAPGGAVRSLCPIEAFLRTVAAGRVVRNDDALACEP